MAKGAGASYSERGLWRVVNILHQGNHTPVISVKTALSLHSFPHPALWEFLELPREPAALSDVVQ